MSRVEELNRILRSLQAGTPDIEASALISEDGLMIASALPQHIEELRVAGMSSTLLSLEQVLIRGEDGYAVMVNAASGTSLLVLAGKEAKLGLIFLDMNQAVSELERALSTPAVAS